MATKSFPARLLDQIRRCVRARGGNVAVIFALASFPVVGMVGAAVDYSRANAVKADMQSALDATALMVAKNAGDKTKNELEAMANSYFVALFKNADATTTTISLKYDKNASTIELDGKSIVNSDFIGIMGSKFEKIPVTSSSTVSWGSSKLRVALALDNTGSMASNNKMTALKAAAKNLIDQLNASAKNNGDVYVSIVPFAKDVNVGKHNYKEPWVRFDLWDKANPDAGDEVFSGSICISGQLWMVSGNSWSKAGSCTGQAPGICYKGQIWNWSGSKFVVTGSCPNESHKVWNGCVTDRDQDYDVVASAPDSTKLATLFPAEQHPDCPQELMPLSYNWTQLKKKIDDMQPNGYTNVTIGAVWGWQTLLTDGPFPAPAEDPYFKSHKVLILLTDGDNTENRFTKNQADIDARTKKVCEAAKKQDITIYTVLVMEGNKSLLEACATDAKKYFYLQSADGLVAVFNTIGTQLSNLRVSK